MNHHIVADLDLLHSGPNCIDDAGCIASPDVKVVRRALCFPGSDDIDW